MSITDPTAFLRSLFDAAVAAADPMRAIPAHLPRARPEGRVLVVGAGKATARMAEAVEALWGGCEGLVITRYGHACPTRGIEVVEAAHPVPDAAGAAATARMLALLEGADEGDLVLALISGGASALMVAPAEGVTLADKQAVNAALLTSGAPIGQMNLVRRHLSRVKGGRLAAAAWPARVLALMISDVPGDDPAVIGSGPTVGEASRPNAAAAILGRHGIDVPASVSTALARGDAPPAPDDPRLSRVENRIIAAPAQSLAAAADTARAAGCRIEMLGDDLEGEARVIAHDHAALALARQEGPEGLETPLLILSGGELTVTHLGHKGGRGGPNAEYVLALGQALAGAPGIWAIACDTDGIDGADAVAGAQIGPDFPARVAHAGQDPADALARNDAHGFFAAIGGQVVTGPTLTNVNDFRAILVMPKDRT